MIRKTALAALWLMAFGCGQKQTPEGEPAVTAEQATENSFQAFSKKIRPVSLPFQLNCDEEPGNPISGIPEDLMALYGRENAPIFGKITENDAFTAILFLMPTGNGLPVLETTDKNGNKISELALYERWCGGNGSSWNLSSAHISEDLTITLQDSTIRFRRGANGQIIDSTRNAEVRKRIFRIDENGIINEMNGNPKQSLPDSSRE